MTTILERMREELVRRNYAANTIYTYSKIAVEFQRYVAKPGSVILLPAILIPPLTLGLLFLECFQTISSPHE